MAVPFSRPKYPTSTSSTPPNQVQNQQDMDLDPPSPPPLRARARLGRRRSSGGGTLLGEGVLPSAIRSGRVDLDTLSLTSRIAFYALYEALRLLKDLSGGDATDEIDRSNAKITHQRMLTNKEGDSDDSDEIGEMSRIYKVRKRGRRHSTPAVPNLSKTRDKTLPDILNSDSGDELTQDLWVSRHQMKSRKKPRRRKRSILHQEKANLYGTGETVTSEDERDGAAILKALPDLIPSNSEMFMDDFVQCSSHEPHRSMISIKANKSEDIPLAKMDIKWPGSISTWSEMGMTLGEMAAAFDHAYGPVSRQPQNQEERLLFEAYERIKRRCLVNDAKNVNCVIGLAKTLCRQILMSTVWILLRSIL